MTQAANEGTFGKVQAAQKGVLPWQIASMTGNQASTNAYAAVKQLSEIAGPGTAVKTTNKYGETEEISAKDAKLAIPFGPYLAFGAVLYIFYGKSLIRWYLGLSGVYQG